VLFIERTQCAGDPESHRTCLAAHTTALDIRDDIILPKGIGNFKGLDDIGSESLEGKVILYRSIVDGDFSGTGE
jgi:hypothetical protein